jgi:hypothetical protein
MLTPLALFLGLLAATAFIAHWSDNLGKKLGKKRVSVFGLRPRTSATILTVVSSWAIMGFTLVALLLAVVPLRTALFHFDEERARFNREREQFAMEHARFAAEQTLSEHRLKVSQERRKAAETQAAKANTSYATVQGQLVTAQGQIATANQAKSTAEKGAKRASERQTEAQRGEANAKRGEQKAQEAEQNARQAEATVRQNLAAATGNLNSVRTQLTSSKTQLGLSRGELQNVRVSLSNTKFQLNSAHFQLRQAQLATRKARQAQVKAAQAERRASQAAFRATQAAFKATKQQLQTEYLANRVGGQNLLLASSDIAFAVDHTLSERRFPDRFSPEEGQTQLRQLLVQSQNAAQLLLRNTGNEALANAVKVVPAGVAYDNQGNIDASSEARWLKLYGSVLASGGQSVLARLVVASNTSNSALLNVPVVEARLLLVLQQRIPEGKVFSQGTINGAQSEADIYGSLYSLIEEARRNAIALKVSPPLSPESPTFFASDTNQKILDALREVQKVKRPVSVRLVAARDLNTAEPLQIRFQIGDTGTT